MKHDVARLVETVTAAWERDPGNDVVWTGDYEGRRGVRFRQSVRDFTTMWLDIGDRTLGVEAFLLPDPPHNRADVYRYCLRRNATSWPVHIALDRPGDLVIVGRIGLEAVSENAIDGLLGSVYELVEVSFRPLVRLGFSREKTT